MLPGRVAGRRVPHLRPAALAERVKVEREAAKQLEDAKKAQLDTEKRYSEALAKLGGAGAGDPSYGQAQALKVGARAALAGAPARMTA